MDSRAGGMVPADLAGVLRSGSGGARLVLETLLADPQTAVLDPVLMTGRHVAGGGRRGGCGAVAEVAG